MFIFQKNPDLKIVFNPEFLTERSANFDFINQTRFILGGESDDTKKVSNLFKWRFGKTFLLLKRIVRAN